MTRFEVRALIATAVAVFLLMVSLAVASDARATGIGNGSGAGRAGNIATSYERCTAATLVTYKGRSAVLTAGHCTLAQRGRTWRQGSRVIGSGYMWTFGSAGDFGVIYGGANVRRARAVRNPIKGESVDVATARGVFRGRVISATTSLRYASPGVSARTAGNLVMVSGVCVRGGDSGSGVWRGSTFLGVVVAKSSKGCYLWMTRAGTAFALSGMRVR